MTDLTLTWRSHAHRGNPVMTEPETGGFRTVNDSADDRGTWIGMALLAGADALTLSGEAWGVGTVRALWYQGKGLLANSLLFQGMSNTWQSFRAELTPVEGADSLRVDLRLWDVVGAAEWRAVALQTAGDSGGPGDPASDSEATFYEEGQRFELLADEGFQVTYRLWDIPAEQVYYVRRGGGIGLYTITGDAPFEITIPIAAKRAAVQGQIRPLHGPMSVKVTVDGVSALDVVGRTIGRGWYQFTRWTEAPQVTVRVEPRGADGLLQIAPLTVYPGVDLDA